MGLVRPSWERGNILYLSITSLDLNTNQLTSIPSEIGNLISLTTLRLSENQLTSIPESFCDIKDNLTEYSFSGNSICGELPSCLTADDIGGKKDLGEQNCP